MPPPRPIRFWDHILGDLGSTLAASHFPGFGSVMKRRNRLPISLVLLAPAPWADIIACKPSVFISPLFQRSLAIMS